MSENVEIKALEDELSRLRESLATLQFDRTLASTAAEITKLNKEISKAREAITDQNKKLEEARKQQEELTKSQKKYSESIDKATGVIEDFRAGVMNVDFSFNNYSKTLNSASKGLVEAAGGALSFTAAANGYTGVAAKLEVATKASSVALQKFSEHLLNQAGSMLEAFDSIASIGGASTLTSSTIEQLGRNADFSGEALKFFGKLTKEQGGNLTAFGGSVGKGAEEFSRFIDLTADQRKQYRLLGISQNQMAEYQGFYADNLLKSGMSIDRGEKAMDKLRQSSLDYRDILYALTNISGDSLEEQQKALDFQAQNANFQATLAQKDIQRVKLLEEAEKLEDGAAKDALLAEAKKIEDQAELMKLMALEYSPDKVGVENATAMMEMLATGGEAVTQNTVAFDMLNPAIRDTVRELSNFSGENIEEGIKDLIIPSKKAFTDAVDQQLADLGPMAGLLGKEILSVWGISTEGIAEAAKLRQTTVENMISAYEEGRERDKSTESLVAFSNALNELGITLREKFGEVFAGFLGPDGMLPSLTSGISSFTKMITDTGSGLVVGLTLLGGTVLGAFKAMAIKNIATRVGDGGSASVANRTALDRERNIEKRVDSRGRPYYTDSSTGRRVSNEAGEAADRRRTEDADRRTSRRRGIRGGIAGILGGVALDYAGDAAQEAGHTRTAAGLDVASTALSYGGTGAMIGSVIPGIGTVVGGAAGTAIGAGMGLWRNRGALFGGQENEEIATVSTDENEEAVTDSFNEVASSTSSLARTFNDFNDDNSFDELVSTTDMLIETFGSLNTTINSSNISNRTTRSFDSGTSSANMQTASITPSTTPRSFDSGTNVSEQEAKDFIANNEGTRHEPYLDSRNLWTVGVGHLIGNELPPEMNRRFSHQEVMDLFDSDYTHHRNAAERIPGFNRMDDLGQTALTDLTFNMGPSWINGWPNLSNQLGEGDIPSAAENLRNSRWYDQVGNRGPRVANMLEDSTMISAAQGGIASGPETGYLGKLHGTELIQPINSESVLSKLATTPESTSDANINSNEIQTRMSEMYRSNMMLVETLNSKLDSMISKLEDGNYIQERILSNTV